MLAFRCAVVTSVVALLIAAEQQQQQQLSGSAIIRVSTVIDTCTDAPSILCTSSILGVSSTFRTASTGNMSSKSTASIGVSEVSNPEILRV